MWLKPGLPTGAGASETVRPRTDCLPARAAAAAEGPPVDMENAMARFGNDRVFYREILGAFIGYLPDQLRSLEDAAKAGTTDEVQKLAHTIKGSSGNLGAVRASMIAQGIGLSAGEKDFKGTESLIRDLKRELERLEEFAEAFETSPVSRSN